MPTPRGLSVIAAGIGLWFAGRVLGTDGLEQLGFGLVALVAIAVAALRLGQHDIEVKRAVTPPRVTAGHEVTVGLRLDNLGEGGTPLVLMEDEVPADLAARPRFVLDGLRAGARGEVLYSIRPRRRGRWRLGPLKVRFQDPFGVAQMQRVMSGHTDLLVLPRVERLALPHFSTDRRSLVRSSRTQLTAATGEDLYTLREYVEGDDLRRIHWPATARRDRFMVRQEETPWQARATVLLDDRREVHSAPEWEKAIEVAASLLDLFARSGFTFSLVAVHGEQLGPAKAERHLDRCLERLATVAPVPSPDHLERFVSRIGGFTAKASGEDILIVVSGNLARAASEAILGAAPRCRDVVVVDVGSRAHRSAAAPSGNEGAAFLRNAGVRLLELGTARNISPGWDALWSGDRSAGEGGGAWAQKRAHA